MQENDCLVIIYNYCVKMSKISKYKTRKLLFVFSFQRSRKNYVQIIIIVLCFQIFKYENQLFCVRQQRKKHDLRHYSWRFVKQMS
jgi:hypothetical protein